MVKKTETSLLSRRRQLPSLKTVIELRFASLSVLRDSAVYVSYCEGSWEFSITHIIVSKYSRDRVSNKHEVFVVGIIY